MCPSWHLPQPLPLPNLYLSVLSESTHLMASLPVSKVPASLWNIKYPLWVASRLCLGCYLSPPSVITPAESNSLRVILLSLTSVVPLIGEPFVLLCSQESITALFVFSLHFVHIFVIVSHRGHLRLLMDKSLFYLRLLHMATQVFYPPTPENTVCVIECKSCQCDGSACTTGINNGSCFLWNRSQARLLCHLTISV